MIKRPVPRELQAVYPDADARRAFDHGATVTFWEGDYAENLLARFWPSETNAKSADPMTAHAQARK